ncbi:MAG TPA: peptide-methionine (S)-S-oxide reductase MsrA [Candidatus Nanoarchaeia archaeon]|nr:peptide-methionine (S)-S-oxide reductase MsrA [Candidatus Nanoarchaeia archaeon]
MEKLPLKKEIATFAAGCFWHVELAFSEVPGVLKTSVGYTGGKMKQPTYEKVCTDATGHAEAVDVTFDAAKISYEKLLDVFFRIHDPTQINRQGFDIGSQYRSAIFFHNDPQKKAAEAAKKRWQKKFSQPIVTEIVKQGAFYEAEEYHQKYLIKKGKRMC